MQFVCYSAKYFTKLLNKNLAVKTNKIIDLLNRDYNNENKWFAN